MRRSCIWGRSWRAGFASWWNQGRATMQPSYGDQSWRFSTILLRQPASWKGFPPASQRFVLCPVWRWDAKGAKEAAGAFAFRSLERTPGAVLSLPPVLHRPKPGRLFIAMARCGYLPRLFMGCPLGCGRQTSYQIMPIGCFAMSRPKSISGERPPEQLRLIWRDWQQGQQVWCEPGYKAVPSWAEGRRDSTALPAPCRSCGCPSVLQCRRCTSPVCHDCIAQCTRCS